jgi:hypothetical protein
MYDAVMRADKVRVATSSVAGIAELYARGDRFTREQAIQEIRNELTAWKIPSDRIGEVMANAATNYVDSDAWRADVALQLLIDAGADVERARAIRAAQPPRRVIGIGGAVLGGLPPTGDP